MPEWMLDPGLLSLIGVVLIAVYNVRKARVEASAPDKIAAGFEKLNEAHRLEIESLRQEISDMEIKNKRDINALREEYDAKILAMELAHRREITALATDNEMLVRKHNQLAAEHNKLNGKYKSVLAEKDTLSERVDKLEKGDTKPLRKDTK